MQNHPQSSKPSTSRIAILGITLTIVSILLTILLTPFSGFLVPEIRDAIGLNHQTSMSTSTATAAASTATVIAGSSTQSGAVNLAPNSAYYGYTINSWSRPAYNTYCEIPTCDPNSQRKDLLREGTIVTATCWTNGQLVITGTLANPGYQDKRWVRLADGTYLPNTWFVRTELSPHLPAC